MKKLKTKEFKGYTEQLFGYFHPRMTWKMVWWMMSKMWTMLITSWKVHNPYDGVDMDTEFEDLDMDSDWFMD